MHIFRCLASCATENMLCTFLTCRTGWVQPRYTGLTTSTMHKWSCSVTFGTSWQTHTPPSQIHHFRCAPSLQCFLRSPPHVASLTLPPFPAGKFHWVSLPSLRSTWGCFHMALWSLLSLWAGDARNGGKVFRDGGPTDPFTLSFGASVRKVIISSLLCSQQWETGSAREWVSWPEKEEAWI